MDLLRAVREVGELPSADDELQRMVSSLPESLVRFLDEEYRTHFAGPVVIEVATPEEPEGKDLPGPDEDLPPPEEED